MGRLHGKQQLQARRIWMFAGIAVRTLLLLTIGWLVNNGNKTLIPISFGDTTYAFNLRNVIMFLGGLFLLYKTVREIHHKLEGDEDPHLNASKKASFSTIIGQIIVIDMVFSFDSII